jgi:hypothetical protein
MTLVKEYEPPGWRDLCAKLKAAKNSEDFQAIVNEINQLLTAHEKSHPEDLEKKSEKPRLKRA